MANYRRAFIPGGTFFFTVVTHARRRFLCHSFARTILREAITDVRCRYPFDIDAFVLLPDHLHCIWTLPQGDSNFSVRWNQIKGKFTRRWLERGGGEAFVNQSRLGRRERGVWQRRLFEHACRDKRDLKRCLDYLHVNPLKHGLANRVADWPWSSFHRYVTLGEYTSEWGNSNEWYGDEWRLFE